MSKILIAGCGDVGIALGLMLVDDGHRVYALRRNVNALPSSLQPIAADLSETATLRALPSVDYVYYTAAADGRDEAAYERAYVSGVRNIVQSLKSSARSVRRLFFVSSTGVYGQDAGEWVDELSATEPKRFTGKILLEGEASCHAGPIPATVVRFGGIYGPGRSRLIDQVKSGASCISDPPQYTNRIHRDDCAGVLRHLMSIEAAEAVYAGVDSEPATQCEVFDWLARRLGAPAPDKRQADPSSGQGKRVSNARLLNSGYEFRYPTFRQGYDQVIATLPDASARATP